MAKRIIIQPHLSSDELEARYRQAKDPIARTHFQIVWLLCQGIATRTVSKHTGYSVIWVQRLAKRYNDKGPAALGDKRRVGRGATPLLNPAQQQELWQALQGPAPDGGLWTSQKVADWISQKTGRSVRVQRGWEYLRKLGFSLQRPRPRHSKADKEQQEAFKKGTSKRSSKRFERPTQAI